LADEPTGNLHAASANESLSLLATLNNEQKKTIVMVTHDPHAARFAKSMRYLDKGMLLPEGKASEDWIVAPISSLLEPSLAKRSGLRS